VPVRLSGKGSFGEGKAFGSGEGEMESGAKVFSIIFNSSLPSSEKTQIFTITKISSLTLFKEIIAVYFGNHVKLISTFCDQNAELLNVKADCTCSYHCF
jgi:hypothetical protein